MALTATLNTNIPKQEDYIFDWEFVEDDEITLIDISTWLFQFIMKDYRGAVIWNIQNSDFTRPTISRISFTKTVADMTSLSGIYSISLLVTKSETIDDEYVNGVYEFQ